MDKAIFKLIEGYMLSCMDDSAHDAEHIYRVLSNAMVIARDEVGVNYDVLIAACLLHDIGRPDQIRDPSLCHASVGCERAYHFLLEKGFSDDFAARVRDCIRPHRFRKNDQPESLEAKILFDADKLDVVGAIGIARTLVYKGTVTEPLYTRREDGTISDGAGEEPHSFFQEYHRKLNKLYDRFYTQSGHRLAQQRRKAARDFYESLYREVTALDEQGKTILTDILG
jgi:uncharacterized protein